jgi:hypothetical protein
MEVVGLRKGSNSMSESMIAHVEQRTIYKCDICGEPASRGKHTCTICRRDLCTKHILSDPRNSSDYADAFCQRCWNVGEPFRAEQAVEEERHEKIVDDILSRWHRECSEVEGAH